MSKIVLKKCPFCGGEAEVTFTGTSIQHPYVRCRFGNLKEPKCPMAHYVTYDYDTVKQAVEAWNRRAK